MKRLFLPTPTELQGHAIKNQDLLIASGALSLKGSDSLTALEEDVEAVSSLVLPSSVSIAYPPGAICARLGQGLSLPS
jgi:hypothetical protein